MSETDEAAPRGPWYIEHKIPLTLVCTILVGVGTGLWNTSSAYSNFNLKLDQLDRERALSVTRIDTLETSRTINSERIARIEQKTLDIWELMHRIEGKLDKLRDRP